jgi:hypothetical protein
LRSRLRRGAPEKVGAALLDRGFCGEEIIEQVEPSRWALR